MNQSTRSLLSTHPQLAKKMRLYHQKCPDTMATKRISDFQSSIDYLLLRDFNHFVEGVYQQSFVAEKRIALIMGILQRNGLPDVSSVTYSNYTMIHRDLQDLIDDTEDQNLQNVYRLEQLYLISAVKPVDDGSVSLNQK